MEGLDGKVTIFHMAHKGDLRQVQALIQDDPRYLRKYFIKFYFICSIWFTNIFKIFKFIIFRRNNFSEHTRKFVEKT